MYPFSMKEVYMRYLSRRPFCGASCKEQFKWSKTQPNGVVALFLYSNGNKVITMEGRGFDESKVIRNRAEVKSVESVSIRREVRNQPWPCRWN